MSTIERHLIVCELGQTAEGQRGHAPPPKSGRIGPCSSPDREDELAVSWVGWTRFFFPPGCLDAELELKNGSMTSECQR